MNAIIFTLTTLAFLLAAKPTIAADSIAFDSTDNYLGACQYTNKSSWELTKDLVVSKFQIWYKWNQGETSLPVTVLRDGEKFAQFDAKRGDCDPYQTTWCNADYTINKLFPKGSYRTEIPNSRQCLKPGGTGTVRLYQSDTAPATPTPTPTPTIETKTVAAAPASCTCNQTITIAVATVLSSILSVGVSLLLRKR